MWREQLAHLLRMSVRQYVNFQVIPRSVGAHAGVAGDFRVMKFPKYPPLVCLDTLNRGLFFDDKETVALYQGRIKKLAAVALDREQSRAVIDNILEGSPMIDWRKSSYSSTANQCVEVGRGAGVRDSKAPAAHLAVSATAWAAFLGIVKGDSAR